MGEYWATRIQKQNENLAKLSIQEAEKKLYKVYAAQAKDLQAAILEVFAKLETENFTLNDLYRNKRYWELLNRVNELISALGKKEFKITQKSLIQTYEKTLKTIDEGIPKSLISPQFLVPSAINAEQLINQVWCADGKSFSDRIWNNKKKLQEQLAKNLGYFVVQGKSPFYISEQLRIAMEVNSSSAYRIVRTETAHLQIKTQTERYMELGFTHGKYLGTNCCDKCQEKTGKIYTLKELESMIPLHPNCTCTFTLVPKAKGR